MKAKARNSANTKIYNRNLIISMIRDQDFSRADIARETGLTRAAITLIVDELIGDGIVIEAGSAETEHGRKPIKLDINANRFFAIGLDIARETCALGAIDFKGNVLHNEGFTIPEEYGLDQAISKIKERIRNLLHLAGDKWGGFLGIGISVPGPVDAAAGTILNPPNFEMWHGVKLVELLQKEFNIHAFMENNSISRTLGEKHYGWGKNVKSFMLIVVDTGVGAGIIIDKKLYRGFGGFGSEIGHTCIDINGGICDCGNIGCLELYASIPSILKYGRDKGMIANSWDEVVDAAETGDQAYIDLVEREGRYLAAAIVNSINLLELEAIVMTGYINYKPERLMGSIQKYVNSHAINRNIRTMPVYISAMVKDAKIISAATIAIDKFCGG